MDMEEHIVYDPLYGMCMQHKLRVWTGIDVERPYMPGDRLQRNGGLQQGNENCTSLSHDSPLEHRESLIEGELQNSPLNSIMDST